MKGNKLSNSLHGASPLGHLKWVNLNISVQDSYTPHSGGNSPY